MLAGQPCHACGGNVFPYPTEDEDMPEYRCLQCNRAHNDPIRRITPEEEQDTVEKTVKKHTYQRKKKNWLERQAEVEAQGPPPEMTKVGPHQFRKCSACGKKWWGYYRPNDKPMTSLCKECMTRLRKNHKGNFTIIVG